MNHNSTTIGFEPGTFEISPKLRQRLVYPRFRNEQGCALILDAGYFIQRECVNGFRQNGWKTIRLSVAPIEDFIERLLIAIMDHRPDLLFTVNHLGFDGEGVLTGLLESIELPIVSWYVDSPAYILLDHRRIVSEYVITPIWERAYAPFMKEFGFRNVFHLPLAGDPEIFNSHGYGTEKKYNVGFVGDSMMGAVRKWFGKIPDFEGKSDFITTTAEKLSGEIAFSGNKYEMSTLESVDAVSVFDERERLSLESTVVLEATRLRRKRMVEILQSEGLEVFGDDGWRSYLPPGVKLHPGPDYYRDLPFIYRSTGINLNSTSVQMPTTVNQRVFDAPLAGGFLLTDAQSDLDELFTQGKEVIAYSEIEELPELVRYYRSRDTLRAEITKNAAARIIGEHTYRHRIAKVIDATMALVGKQPVSVAVAV